MAWPEKETDVAAPVVAWLRECGWEVFQEVERYSGGGGDRADIVARRGRVVWVIEVKRSLTLTLLAQAAGWRGHAHRVSIAYPRGRSAGRENAKRLARLDGLGLIEVMRAHRWSVGHKSSDLVTVVEEIARGEFRRRARVTVKLVEDQKTYAEAGNASGRFWSPFKRTCELVREVVEAEPGLGISEVVTKVDHHYASKQSAHGSLLSWARAGKLKGVVVRGGTKAEGKFRLYPSEWQGPLESREMLRSK